MPDIGGHADDHEGLIDRFMRHAPRLDDNLDDGVPTALRTAGLVDAAETGHRASRVVGRLTTAGPAAPATRDVDGPTSP